MSNITLPLFVLVTIRDSWFIEEQNSFLAHVNPLGPTHVSFYYGFRWHRESERRHIKKVIIFLLWLTSVRKLTFCFADRKQQFDSQLFACHPLNAFVCLCLLVKKPPSEKIYQRYWIIGSVASQQSYIRDSCSMQKPIPNSWQFFAFNKKLE